TAEDQHQLAGPALGAVQGRAGEGVEGATAMAAAEVQDRGAATAMNGHAVVSMAARAGHAVGVQPGDELVIARLFIHQVADREVHGGLRTEVSRMRSPEYRRAGAGCKRPAHRFPYMSHNLIWFSRFSFPALPGARPPTHPDTRRDSPVSR